MKTVWQVLGVTFAFVFAASLPSAIAEERPNIVLIYVDDLGFGDLGRYGHPIIKTPHLDGLAAEGMTFTNNYAPSALCSPSRAALLTGRTPYRTGIQSWIPEDSGIYLRDVEVTLAELLRTEGYQTALIGKWHLNSDLGDDDQPQPTDQGFDYFYGHNAFQSPSNRNPVNVFRGKELLPPQEGYTAQLYVDEAVSWLEQRDADQPFFLYLSMAEPHTEIENPPEYNALYEDHLGGETFAISSPDKADDEAGLLPEGPGEYYANITYMDAQIGHLLHWLRVNKLEDNTVIVFSSDNGPVKEPWINWWEENAYGSTAGLRERKHFLYEGGIRVPAFIRYPGVVAEGAVSHEPVIGMDWFATLAEIGGAELPEADWKLMVSSNKQPLELFNLRTDPLEFYNVLNGEGERVEALMDKFREIYQSIEKDKLRPQ